MGVDMAGQGRLMVIDKVSIINPLPASYEAQIKQIDGVTDTTHANWFGGYYQDVRNQFADVRGRPGELAARSIQRNSTSPRIRRRRCSRIAPARSSASTPRRNTGSRSASAFRSRARSTAAPMAVRGSSRSTGSTTRRSRARTRPNLVFNYQFLRETIPERSGFRDRYNWYVFTIANPDRAPEIAAKIDAMFANSPSETKTNTEKAFVSDWAKQVGDIGSIMMWIVAMAMFTILLVAGNTMAQAIRERTNELAVLKTLGFGEGRILWMVLLESVLIALVGGGLGLALSYAFITFDGRSDARAAAGLLLPDAGADGRHRAWSRRSASAPASCPRWQASRLRIVDALRRN